MPSWPCAIASVEEALGLLGQRGLDASRPHRVGDARQERGAALGERQVEEVLPVDVEAVEEHRRQRHLRAERIDVELAAEPAHRHLEGCGRPSGSSAIASPSRTIGLDREREDGRDDLGHAVGDVREVAGVRPDLCAEPVHLDPCPVELPLHDGRADALDRLPRALRRLREHRLQGPEHLEPEPCEPGAAVGERRGGDRAEVAGEHERAPHLGRRDIGCAGDSVRDDALERSLPELALEERAEEALLTLRRAGEEPGERAPAGRLRARARRGADRPERGVDLEELERRRPG